MKKKMAALLCAALVFCAGLSGCGGKGAEEENPIKELEPVPIESTDAGQSAGQDAGEDSASDGAEASGTEASNGTESASSETGASGGAEAPAEAPVVAFEIMRDARADEAGEETAFSEYPVFTVTGNGYEELRAAMDSINEDYRSKNAVLLDELQENVKDYRESVDPAGVFGQGTSAYIYRCDMDVVSIMVMRTVNMGGPHPNNYWDYYNLDSGTGENLQLSEFITMDAAMTETVIERLHDNYPEVEFDDEVLKQEIPSIFADDIDWYFYEGQINLAFPEGSFGFGHAAGSLEVTVPLE